MAIRGVQFSFQPGEYVLCFEPDLSKARVLYDAKILDQTVSKGYNGKKRPEYHIHFQGWNSSWDRVVPECFVIKDTKENRSLMGRLASVAKNIKSNKARMRRIDRMLQEHFGRKLNFDSDASGSETEEEEDDEEDEEEEVEDQNEMEADFEQQAEVKQRSSRSRSKEEANQNGNQEEEANEEEQETEEQESDNKENEESMETDPSSDEQEEEVDLMLHENLRKKLEDDCYFINAKKQLVSLPASPNVITLLEGYVKNFAVNILCATVEKNRPNLRDADQKPSPEKNIDLCKEVVSGLRVFFDFALPTMLLYNTEQTQLENLRTTFKTETNSPAKSNGTTCRPLQSPTNKSESSGLQSPRQRSSQSSSTSHKQEHKSEFSFSDEDEKEEETPARRITRRTVAEVKRGGESPRTDKEDTTSSAQRRDSLRSRGRHGSAASPGRTTSPGRTSPRPVQEEKSQPEKTKPVPVPLPQPCRGSHHSPPSAPHTPTIPSHDACISGNEAAVNDVFSWQLLSPDDLKENNHLLPCTVYGAHHLLRLFVKLPGLIARMQLPEERLTPLLLHIQLIIDYLSERSEELFPETVYTTAAADSVSR